MEKYGEIEMSWQQYRHYLRQVLTLPPHITWRKVRSKIGRRLQRDIGRLRSHLLGTEVSNAQFLRALDHRFRTIQAFLECKEIAGGPHFFLCPERREEVISAIQQVCPESAFLTIAAADRACCHVFDMLGSGPIYLGERIDWHMDFKTGYRWSPRQYYADVRHAPYPGGYDIKVPWELSRCQHFAWIGQAYWDTNNEKYAQEFMAQVLDWIAQNPPQFGVNWTCAMDVAIRAVNWLWGYYFFKDSPSLTDEFRLAFFKSLLVHGRHVMNNLEWTETLTSNHYLSNIVGLVHLGILLPEFKEARRWREFGLQELEKEMFKQVYHDGVGFEASVSYHRLAVELFLSTTILARLNNHTFSYAFMDRLRQMLEFTMYVTKPDGTVPLIGDSDNGRLHRLKVWSEPVREWNDHRYLLAIGAVLFPCQDFAQAAGDQWEEAIWLFGEKALVYQRESASQDSPPLKLASHAFLYAGLYVMRHDDLYLIVDAGSNGQNGNGGHAHNDVLSFELYDHGQTWLVDPGTYLYTADYKARDQFRSTAFHNTIVVDRQEQNRFVDRNRLFQIQPDTCPTVHRWESTREYDILDASHDGYARLPEPVIHRRQIFFNKRQPPFWVIRDLLTGMGQHTFDLLFHVGDATINRSHTVTIELESRTVPGNYLIIVPLVVNGLTVTTEDVWRAHGYGQKIGSIALKYSKTVSVPYEFVTVLWPCRSSTSPAQAEAQAQAAVQPIWQRLVDLPATGRTVLRQVNES